jgi:hypothetical protein
VYIIKSSTDSGEGPEMEIHAISVCTVITEPKGLIAYPLVYGSDMDQLSPIGFCLSYLPSRGIK